MALAQADIREAFAVLVERHARRIVRLCARYSGNAELGAELAQATWVEVWFRRAQYRGDGRFLVWLITVARNRCMNHVRRNGVARRHANAMAVLGEMASPDRIDELLAAERKRRVRDALARLPEPMREALMLRFGEDLRYDEMAKVTRVGESTLRSRVRNGLRLLRKSLERNR